MTPNELHEGPKLTHTEFWMKDHSGSFGYDGKMEQVNQGIPEAIEIVKNEIGSKADVRIASVAFATETTIETPNGPERIQDYVHTEAKAEGLTNFAPAILALDHMLSRNTFLKTTTSQTMPDIFWWSDGQPTDDPEELSEALAKLWDNAWYCNKDTTKVAFAIGKDADHGFLQRLVGDTGAVITIEDIESLSNHLRVTIAGTTILNAGTHMARFTGKDAATQAERELGLDTGETEYLVRSKADEDEDWGDIRKW